MGAGSLKPHVTPAFVTAFAGDVQASLDAGMNGHVAKPIVLDEIVKAIARNIQR